MSKDYTTVVDFGTQKITVAVGFVSRGELEIVGSGEVNYGGYMQGEFLEINKLGEVIKNVITIAENNSNLKINNIVVGVPSAFATVVVKEVTQNYNKKIRVTPKVLQGLFAMGNDFAKYSNYTLISSDAIEMSLDDGMSVTDCVGMTTSKIKAKISYILAENRFINLIEEITNILGIHIDRFICTALAEYKYLVKNISDTCAMIDCGHLSTSVTICKGNGIEALAEFSLGGGLITSDLMKWLKLDYDTSEMLKRKVVLSIIPEEQDVYEIKSGKEVLTLPAYSTNGVVTARVEKIASATLQCIEKYKNLITDHTRFYLCGGGISYIKGAKDIFCKGIGHTVDIICPNIPQLARPHYSAVLSLLYIASLDNYNSKKLLFFRF